MRSNTIKHDFYRTRKSNVADLFMSNTPSISTIEIPAGFYPPDKSNEVLCQSSNLQVWTSHTFTEE